MIFVCLTPGIPLNLGDYYGELLDECAFFGIENWAFLGARVIEGPNWKLTFNNFLETYHFATLHRKTVAGHALSNVNHFEGFGPNMRTSVVQRSISHLRDYPRSEWGEREGWEYTFIRIFFPNVTASFSFDPEGSLFTQTFPGPTPDKCRIVCLYLRKNPPRNEIEAKEISDSMDYSAFDITRGEDSAICVSIQSALESQAHRGLLYGCNERGNQYFHEWLNWYLQEDSSLPKPSM
jgi:phenylpropionate dioxygenase-like ring-hydroxylating dioxygenase large terminal subunit